jgi:uncharacterized damage-inducible protein DinB
VNLIVQRLPCVDSRSSDLLRTDFMDVTLLLDDLLKHMEWADALVWTAVLSSPVAMSDSALRDRLYHVHGTQHGFLQVWSGVAADERPNGFQDTADLARWARQCYSQLRSSVSLLIADTPGAPIPASLVLAAEAGLGPGSGAPSMLDTVLQVVTHGIYHRGQINMRLRELGCMPPLTEYFVWVWQGKPDAPWPVATS